MSNYPMSDKTLCLPVGFYPNLGSKNISLYTPIPESNRYQSIRIYNNPLFNGKQRFGYIFIHEITNYTDSHH